MCEKQLWVRWKRPLWASGKVSATWGGDTRVNPHSTWYSQTSHLTSVAALYLIQSDQWLNVSTVAALYLACYYHWDVTQTTSEVTTLPGLLIWLAHYASKQQVKSQQFLACYYDWDVTQTNKTWGHNTSWLIMTGMLHNKWSHNTSWLVIITGTLHKRTTTSEVTTLPGLLLSLLLMDKRWRWL